MEFLFSSSLLKCNISSETGTTLLRTLCRDYCTPRLDLHSRKCCVNHSLPGLGYSVGPQPTTLLHTHSHQISLCESQFTMSVYWKFFGSRFCHKILLPHLAHLLRVPSVSSSKSKTPGKTNKMKKIPHFFLASSKALLGTPMSQTYAGCWSNHGEPDRAGRGQFL